MERIISENKAYTSAVIVCAGNSTRMGGANKQFLTIDGVSVIERSVSAFQKCNLIDEIIIVTREQDISEMKRLLSMYSKVKAFTVGGNTRQLSVINGINACSPKALYIAIHDGARPLVTQNAITVALHAAYSCGAAAVGVRVKDTVKLVDGDDNIVSTPDREYLRFVQTPQIFSKDLYLDALKSVENSEKFTDDCMLIEAYGHAVKIVEGSYSNIKITTAEDIITAEMLLKGLNDD